LNTLSRQYLRVLHVALVSLILAGPAHASEPPLPIDQYWQEVQETQALVISLEDTPPEVSRVQLLTAANRWESITEVALPDGTLIPVDHGFLVSRLRADPPNLRQLDGLLTALLAAHDTWPQPVFTSGDTGALDRILARPEFQWQPQQLSPLAEWWQRLQERFWELVTRLLPDDSRIAQLPLVRYALTGLGTMALILVLTYVMRGLVADFVAETEINPESEAGDGGLTAAAALKRAQMLSGEGDYRTAVRYLYLSSLLLLEERGLLRYDRSLTNREHLRSVAHLPQLATAFRDVVEVFDRVWYGYQPLDEAAYARYVDRVMELRQQK
jgi:hypothetical protein